MLMKEVRRLSWRLPEPVLYTLVRTRHGEMAWQNHLRGSALARVSSTASMGYVRRPGGARGLHARVVGEFDAHQAREMNVRSVSAALEAAGIAHALVPQTRKPGRRVVVSAEDRSATLEALAAALSEPEWAVESTARRTSSAKSLARAVPASRLRGSSFGRTPSLRVFRVLAAPGGQLLAGAELACCLDFWRPVENRRVQRPDGGTFAVGTRLAPNPDEVIVAYLSPRSWLAATLAPGHWLPEAARSTLFTIREPIDIVYTWVDGADPTWLSRKAAFDADVTIADLNDSATHVSRFHSRDELRYSLRSVAMYAGWARKIFLVTDQQVPAWLDTSHPQIEVVDHTRIFRDPSVLPVFNSHAIESQLHHIPGLAEHYVYMNDDVFFGRPVAPELFFHGNGAGKFFLSRATLDIDPPSSQDLPVLSAAKHNRELIEERFDATVIHKFKHTPHPQLRCVLEEMEANYPDMFSSVAASRFRHPHDLSISSSLHHYYAYGIGKAMPATIRYVYWDIARPDIKRRLSNLLRNRDADSFCLNDHDTQSGTIDEQHEMLGDFFEQYFPVPSPFELPGANAATSTLANAPVAISRRRDASRAPRSPRAPKW